MNRNFDRDHQHIVEEFAAATLELGGPKARPLDLALAAAEHITNREWLHGRVLSRSGISETHSSVDADLGPVSQRWRLFREALGSGGRWEW